MNEVLEALEKEEVISLSEAARSMPGGKSHPKTIFRYATKGLLIPGTDTRVILETFRSGGRRVTTRQAVRRFNSRLTAPPLLSESETARGDVPSRCKSLAQAERELSAAGI